MRDSHRIIAREMAKRGGGKVIHGNVFGNVSPDIEWLKWLSYEPEFQRIRIQDLDGKKISEVSYEELEEISKYRRNRIFARLFKIYGTATCSEEEYMMVYDYMCNESIEELMLSKLTPEELQYAREEITRLSRIPREELRKKVEEEQKEENYNQLSMVDSYILHMVSNTDCTRSMNELCKKIGSQIEKNEVMRHKSLYYATNPYAKK